MDKSKITIADVMLWISGICIGSGLVGIYYETYIVPNLQEKIRKITCDYNMMASIANETNKENWKIRKEIDELKKNS